MTLRGNCHITHKPKRIYMINKDNIVTLEQNIDLQILYPCIEVISKSINFTSLQARH